MKTTTMVGLTALFLLIPAIGVAYFTAAFVAVFQIINWGLFLWVASGVYAVLLVILGLQLRSGS